MDFGAGKITENSTNYVLRSKGSFLSVEDIAQTIILQKNGYNVELSDLGRVYMGFENTIDEVYIDGQSGVYVSIKKQSGSNAVKVAAVLGTQEMIASVISGNLTTIVVFVPFLIFMNNLEWIGLMAKDLIYTIVSAIVSSLFVAIFLVPVLAGVYLPLRNPNENPVRSKFLGFFYGIFEKGFEGIEKVYSVMLKAVLKHKVISIIAAFAILIGSSDGMEMVAATNVGSVSIFLPPPSQQKDTSSQIQKKLKAHFGEFAGVQFVFAAESMDSFIGADIDICVKGSDLESLQNTCNQIIGTLEKNENLTNIKMDLKTGLPQIDIEIDRKRANALGVSVEAAAIELNNCISGLTATKYNQKGNEYNVIVELQQKDKQSVLNLDKIFVQGSNGPVVLSNFAKLKKDFGAVSINHENKERTVHITAGFADSANAMEMEKSLKQDVLSKCYIPSDIIIDFGGSSKMMKEKTEVFIKIIVFAVLLVFGVMASMYGSFKKPFINMLTVPFLFIGVILIHVLTGQSLSIMSCLGLVMLVGIVVNNGIILVDYTGLLVARGRDVQSACYESGVSRLRPVLMTTLTTVLGMLPMCFSKSGSASLVQPIGMCVVGGLLSSTFVTLLFIPVMYSVMCRKEKGDTLCASEKEGLLEDGNDRRVEIVANQAVQEDIIEVLEKEIPGIEYSIEANVFGKGKSSRKLGSSVWPEMNFRMTIYTNKENSVKILELVESVKQRFANAGISLFVM